MQVETLEKYILITPTEKSIKEFYDKFSADFDAYYKETHLIIDFSDKKNINLEEILLFLHITNVKRENGTSFAIVVTGIDIDAISEDINIVPTLIEAIDTLEMEAIERDLMNF